MGLFDDVLEPPKGAAVPKAGLFDDVLPQKAPPADKVNPPLLESFAKRGGAGILGTIGGALRGLGETLAPEVGPLSPNVQALVDIALPSRRAGQATTQAGISAVDEAQNLRYEAGGGRPTSLGDVIEDPTNAVRYYGGLISESLPAIIAATATRNPSVASAVVGAASGAQEYGQRRQQGESPLAALQDAQTAALLETALGKAPFETALGAAPFLRRAATASAQEAGTEAATQVAQDTLERGRRGVAPDLGSVAANALDAAIVGAATGPVEALGGRERAPEASPPQRDLRAEQLVRDVARSNAVQPTPTQAAPEVAPNVTAPSAPETVPAAEVAPSPAAPIPEGAREVVATTPRGEFRLVDQKAPEGADFSEFGEVRQVQAFDGDKVIGTLTYANDGTPPTIEVDPEYQRRGVGTSMLKLAREQGGVLGEADTGIRNQGAQYRTEQGQAFRAGANEDAVTFAPVKRADRKRLPVSDTLAVPLVPTKTQMDQSSRVEEVPLDRARSNQRDMQFDRFDKGEHPGDLVEGYGDAPVAVRLRNGEYLIYDGNHRTAQAISDGKKSLRMHVIDAESYDPEQAGPRPPKPRNPAEDDDLLAALGMTPDEAAPAPAVQEPRVAAEAVAEPVRATGISNAEVAARREAEGREPLIEQARLTNRETIDKAVTETAANPNLGRETVEKLRSGKPASLEDEAVLFVDAVNLRKERDAALEKLNSGTEEQQAVAKRDFEELEARIHANEEASRAVGTESGRLLQLRRRLLADDYSLHNMERKLRAATGKPLDAAQTAQFRELSQKIAELEKQVAETEARATNAESAQAYEDLFRALTKAQPKKRPTLDRMRAAANESRAALAVVESVPSRKGQSGAAINPVAFYHLARIGAYHVANGAVTLADWTARMRSDLGAKLDEFREMLPAVFRASQEQAKVRSEGPSVDQILAKSREATPKNVRALAEAHIRAGLRGEKAVLEAVASSLDIPVADARRLLVETTPRGPRTISEAKRELADLRKQIRAENRAAGAETRYQDQRAKGIQKRIDALEARIAANDFTPSAPRVERQLSKANEQALIKLDQAKEQFERLRLEAEFAQRSPLGKIWGYGKDTVNLARALMTSLDFSGLLRQGGFISFGHPLRAAKAVPQALKSFVSSDAETKAKLELEKRPNYRLYKKAGLELTGIGGGPLSRVEEAFASRFVDKIPGLIGGGLIRGSGRSYTTLLNRLRADSFDAMLASLARNGENPTKQEAEAIANYINVATGRGKLGGDTRAGEALNTVFFAPKLVASRFQLLFGQPLYGGTLKTRKLIAQEYARFLIGVSVASALAGLMRDEDDKTPLWEWDPRSANFGKLRFGNTFLDPLAGLAQVTTLVSRVGTGETKTQKGEIRPIRPNYTLTDLRRALGEDIAPHKLNKDGSLPFGAGDSSSVLGRFLRTKLAPVPGAIVNIASGSDLIGQEVTPTQTLASLVTPMSFQNVGDVMEEQGVPRGTAIILLGLLGMGMQHREEKKPEATSGESR